MEDVRVVKLADDSQVTSVSTFEEAFGEFSNAKGRGRDRRARRKSDKRQKKTQKKVEKIAGKDEVKRARREGKISRRGDRKSLRQTGRATRKEDKMEARQGRKTSRSVLKGDRRFGKKDMRLRRKQLGQEPEMELDEQTMIETGNGYQDQYQEPTQDQGQYSEEGDTYQDQTGNGAGEYETTQQDYLDEAADVESEGGYEDEGYEDEGYEDEGYEDEGYDEEYPEDDYESDDSDIQQTNYEEETGMSFDGVMGAEDRFSELTDSAPKVSINPGVSDVAARIEWNKERLSRLLVKKAEIEGKNNSTQAIQQAINETQDRISDLQDILRKYSNFEADFSSADGRPCPCAINKASKGMRKQRANEVAVARQIARKNRVEYNRGRAMAQKTDAIQSANAKKSGGDVTPVDAELNPVISNQKIVVPGASNASGTGLKGIDDINDIDAPDIRVVELTSNASGPGTGPGMKINWRAVGIGVVVAAVVIGGYMYYKKHKKK